MSSLTAERNSSMAVRHAKHEPGTAERILDIAERLVQTRGFNNFSYADIATELGITTASLHYHFPGKAELGQALITRYAERFAEALSQIDRDLPDAHGRLEAYARLYADVLHGKRMCMCGILAAEYQTLPKPMRTEVIRFFDDNQRWLAEVLTVPGRVRSSDRSSHLHADFGAGDVPQPDDGGHRRRHTRRGQRRDPGE